MVTMATFQLLDTLPVCRDFKLGLCQRPQCKYIHLIEGKYIKMYRLALCILLIRVL